MTRLLRKRLEKLRDIQDDVSGSDSESEEKLDEMVDNHNDQELQGK